MSDVKERMVGEFVDDKKKKTSRSKHVNDRLRRREKRNEREMMQAAIKDGEFFSALLSGQA